MFYVKPMKTTNISIIFTQKNMKGINAYHFLKII